MHLIWTAARWFWNSTQCNFCQMWSGRLEILSFSRSLETLLLWNDCTWKRLLLLRKMLGFREVNESITFAFCFVLSVSLYVSLSVVPVIQYRKNIGKWPFRVREGVLECLLQSMNFFYIYINWVILYLFLFNKTWKDESIQKEGPRSWA